MENRLTTKYLAAWICVVIFFGALVFSREPENSSNSICLSGGNLLDISKGNIILNALVIIEGETIQYAGPNKPFEQSEDNTLIDCSGKTLLPGLFDAHIHLGGTSTLDYILIGEERKLSGFLYSGVTSVFDLGGVQDWIFGLREAEKRNKRLSPRIFAVGPLFTSPGGHGTEYGVPMALTPTTEQEAREAVRKLAPEKPEMIKIIYEKGAKHFTSLSFRLMETIIDEAHQNDFTVITHTLTLEQAKDAVKAGTDGLAHIFGDKEIDEELLRDMKQNTVFCIPTLAIFEALSTDLLSTHEYLKWPLVKDAVCQEILVNLKKQREIPWLKEYSEVRKMLLQKGKINIKKMFDHGIRLVLGTDAGNPAVFFGPSVHREMELMVEAGIPTAEVIKAATLNAAEILGQEHRLGSISEGKLADILIVEGNPLENIQATQKVFMVIKNGQILDRDELLRKVNPHEKIMAPVEKQRDEARSEALILETSLALAHKIIEAKDILKNGVNTWDPELMKRARDQLLRLLAREKQENFDLLYYMAFCDYRLANYYIASQEMNKAETYTKESQMYLEKAMELELDSGELDALYATMLGFEIAFHQEKAMSLGLQIFQCFGKALEKSPENPRVHLLKGISDLFTPEQFGGGPDAAIKTLSKSIELFGKENIQDPVKPSWGKDEAYTFLGLAYSQKKETKKAEEMFKKALEINPEFGLAKEELRKIKKLSLSQRCMVL